MNSKHLTACIEGHCGGFWFYFQNISVQYGTAELLPFILLLSFFIILFNIRTLDYKMVLFGMIFIVYLVFSLAKTKMISYTAIVMPIAFLSLAALIDALLASFDRFVKIRTYQILVSSLIGIIVAYFLFDINGIYKRVSYGKYQENWTFYAKTVEKKIIDQVKETLNTSGYVLFNANYMYNTYAGIMFYTDHVAYWFIPDPEQISSLNQQGRRIAIIDFGDLPDYILNDPEIIKIPVDDEETLYRRSRLAQGR